MPTNYYDSSYLLAHIATDSVRALTIAALRQPCTLPQSRSRMKHAFVQMQKVIGRHNKQSCDQTSSQLRDNEPQRMKAVSKTAVSARAIEQHIRSFIGLSLHALVPDVRHVITGFVLRGKTSIFGNANSIRQQHNGQSTRPEGRRMETKIVCLGKTSVSGNACHIRKVGGRGGSH